MSVVTNVIIAGMSGCDPKHEGNCRIVNAVNVYLTGYDNERGFQRKHRALVEVSDHQNGEKGFESFLWIGAFNFLYEDEFIGVYREAIARYRHRGTGPQLLMKRQEDDKFLEIPDEEPNEEPSNPARTISVSGSPHGDAPLGRLDYGNRESITRAKRLAADLLKISPDEIRVADYLLPKEKPQ